MYERSPIIGAVLRVLTTRQEEYKVIYKSYSALHACSLQANRHGSAQSGVAWGADLRLAIQRTLLRQGCSEEATALIDGFREPLDSLLRDGHLASAYSLLKIL
jgi:hypothetical protein